MPDPMARNRLRDRRESLATSTTRGFGGRSSQDALRTMQSGGALGPPGAGSPPSRPTATPAQAGNMNAASPGVFNGNTANGVPGSADGFVSGGRMPGKRQVQENRAYSREPDREQAPTTGTWNTPAVSATPDGHGHGAVENPANVASASYDPNAYAFTQGVWSTQGSGAAGTPNQVNHNVGQQPGTEGMVIDPQTGGWVPGPDFVDPWANNGGFQGAGGHGNFVGMPGYMSVQDYENPPQANTLPPLNPQPGQPTPGQLAALQQAQAQIDAGGNLGGLGQAGWRAPNAFTGPGAPGAGGQSIRNDLAQQQTGGAVAGGTPGFDMTGGQTTEMGYAGGSSTFNEATGQHDFGATTDPARMGTASGTSGTVPDELSGYVGEDGNIDEAAIMKALGYNSNNWAFPDIETFQTLSIDAPYTTNSDQFMDPSSPYYVSDPNLQRAIEKMSRAANNVQQMSGGGFPARDVTAARNEYNTLMATLGMYGINWNPLQGLNDPIGGPSPDPGGGTTPPPNRGPDARNDPGALRDIREGRRGASRFPNPNREPATPGDINWTRDDFNNANTDVMDAVPVSSRIEGEIQRMFGGRFAGASAEEQAAMYEMAKSQIFADEQLANKQKAINMLQGGYESTLRENNPLRGESENLALQALQNYNPIDNQAIQNRLAGDYDKALNQSIEAASGAAARRGLSAGSQAGLAANLTGENRQSLGRALGEQQTMYDLADRQAMYDAINNAGGVNDRYLGEELRQLQLLANGVRGAYDPAQNAYGGAADASANLKSLRLAEQAAKGGGGGFLDYANIFGPIVGAML